MKKLVCSLAFMLIGSFAFAKTNQTNKSLEDVLKVQLTVEKTTTTSVTVFQTCKYKVFNSQGQQIGSIEITDVPNDVACGSAAMKAYALAEWNNN